jgi:hypothetical protein
MESEKFWGTVKYSILILVVFVLLLGAFMWLTENDIREYLFVYEAEEGVCVKDPMIEHNEKIIAIHERMKAAGVGESPLRGLAPILEKSGEIVNEDKKMEIPIGGMRVTLGKCLKTLLCKYDDGTSMGKILIMYDDKASVLIDGTTMVLPVVVFTHDVTVTSLELDKYDFRKLILFDLGGMCKTVVGLITPFGVSKVDVNTGEALPTGQGQVIQGFDREKALKVYNSLTKPVDDYLKNSDKEKLLKDVGLIVDALEKELSSTKDKNR